MTNNNEEIQEEQVTLGGYLWAVSGSLFMFFLIAPLVFIAGCLFLNLIGILPD